MRARYDIRVSSGAFGREGLSPLPACGDAGRGKRKRRRHAFPGHLLALVILALALSGCHGMQSALDPAGPQAQDLASLFWIFSAVLGAIWLAVMAALGLVAARRTARATSIRSTPIRLRSAAWRRGRRFSPSRPALRSWSLTALSYAAQKELFVVKDGAAVTIRVTGHQWWWEVRYEERTPSRTFTTANEIHVPVGKPMHDQAESSDVIHSFWVPNLTGKQDLIPGRENDIQIRPSGPASIAANAPSSAASSTRTWACSWSPSRRRSSTLARRPDRRPPHAADAIRRPAQGSEVFLTQALRDVPHDPRHVGGRHGRARSHPCRRAGARSRPARCR